MLIFMIPLWVSFLLPSTAQEPIVFEHTGAVSALAFSPVDGSFVASSSTDIDATIKLWNLQDDTVKHLEGHTDTVDAIAFSPDGQLLSSSGGGKTFLWDIPRLQRIATFEHAGPEIAFSPDGQLLAISGRHVNILDVKNRTDIATLEHNEWVWSVAFSHDGKYLATDAGVDTSVKVWDIRRKEIIATLDRHTDDVNFVTFSPDGRTLASSSWDGEIILWDVSNWTPLGALPSHAAATVKFSPDGKTLASGGHGDVTLWSVETGEPIATLRGHKEWVREIDFSPDSTTLASGDEGGILRIQNIETRLQAQEQRGIVRLIYFLPSDRLPQPDIDARLDKLIKDVQHVYAQQMESQGFESKTFTLETDANGKALVHHVKGKYKDADYHKPSGRVWEEIGEQFDISRNIYLVALDIRPEILDGFAAGYGGPRGILGGTVLIPASGGSFNIDVTTHELGHAFGLEHDFRSNATAKRILLYTSEPMSTSFCAAVWLDRHRYFNPSIRPSFDAPPRIEMLTPRAVPPNALHFRFKVSDADGLHQVQFLTPEVDYAGSLLACKRLDGVTSTTVEFVTTELTPKSESVFLKVMDVQGNYKSSQQFPIDITPLLPVAKVVSLPDANLTAAVRETLNLETDTPLSTHTLLNLIRLVAPNREITDLTGLEQAHNLKELNLGNEVWVNSNNISDLAPLKGLTQLITLDLSANAVSDLSPLAELEHLTRLNLWNNSVSDISPIAELKELRDLNLASNFVSDLSPLAGLSHLNRLYLYDNSISDVSALAELTHLNTLHLSSNTVSDILPLAGLAYLDTLNLNDNGLSDVAPLRRLTHLTALYLEHNSISDISPLAASGEKIVLYLRGNPAFGTPGPKIEGPWFWMIAPIGGDGAAPAAASGIDYLWRASNGTVSEQQVAIHGATAGDTIGDKVWAPGKLAPTGSNNINELMNAIGFGSGSINNHVAYGLIVLNSPRKQTPRMYVGSNDALKVWLNGGLVYNAPVVRSANDYQNFFSVSLKRGENILLIAVYQGMWEWSGFFGFENGTPYSVHNMKSTVQRSPAANILRMSP